jgi:hypothetical protein
MGFDKSSGREKSVERMIHFLAVKS